MQVRQGLFGNTAQQQQGYAQTGANIGSALGRLFGLKDPALESRRIMSEVNYNDPVSLQIAAKELAGMGMIDQAMSLVSDSRKIEEQRSASSFKEREVSAAEERLKAEAEDRAGRLKLSEKELDFKVDELKNRKDLTGAQINEINARINELKKGDYSIKEQKGGIDGNTTVAFVAINDKPPFNTVVIPVTPGASAAPSAPAADNAKSPANRPPLGSFGAPRMLNREKQ
jgi:hypothetical protein